MTTERRPRPHVRRISLAVTAEQVFDTLYQHSIYAFWLDSHDSAGRATGMGRFSFLGDAAGPLARIARADVWTGHVRIDFAGGSQTITSGFFDWLENDLVAHEPVTSELPFGFTLGWVGYLGYELKAECDGARAHRSPDPDAFLIFADRGVVLDHHTGEVYLLALAPPDGPGQALDWLEQTSERLRAVASRPPAPPDAPASRIGDVRLRHDRAEYLGMIGRCLTAIERGESYEICLTNQVAVAAAIDPVPAYRALRRDNPVPGASFCMQCGSQL